MQRLYVDRRRCRRRAPSPENITSPTLELRLPRRNLIGVNIEMLRQLSQRSIALDGGERHLGLEYRCVVPALSSAHRFSCSRPSSPLSGRNSTYRPVQICESSSFPCLIQSTHVGRSISKRSDNFAYHFAPCMPPISFKLG